MTSLRQHLRVLGRRAADDERARRTDLVMALVDRFVYDLGLLTAGLDVELETYVAAEAAQRLRRVVEPAVGGAVTTRPDFGEFAQVRIDGDLLDETAPVHTEVEFEDRSVRVDGSGATVVRLRRRVRLLLLLDPSLTRVVDHRVQMA